MALLFANNNSLSEITTLPASITGGGLTLVSSQTASASASLEFSMDSTYDSYVFKFINIHPSAVSRFAFQTSTNGGSSYGVTATTTFFQAYHTEDGAISSLTYTAVEDQAQSTDFIHFGEQVDSSSSDHSNSGYMQLFNPSSTTFVKHFIATNVHNYVSNYCENPFIAGYFNTTSPINAIQFKFESGTIDDGIIKMYGVA